MLDATGDWVPTARLRVGLGGFQDTIILIIVMATIIIVTNYCCYCYFC